jgi:hypothetical protein
VAGLLSTPDPSEELNAREIMVDDVPGVHHRIKTESAAGKPLRRTLYQQAADQPVIPMETDWKPRHR